MFLPVFTNVLNFVAIPLQKPQKKFYNVYLVAVIAFYAGLTLTSLLHIFRKSYFGAKPMNAILHVLVYVSINVLDIVAIVQSGFRKSRDVRALLSLLDEVRRKTGSRAEKKLLKAQKLAFVVVHLALVPWLMFMSFWVYYIAGFEKLLVYALVYVNHYLTTMEVLKMLALLRTIRNLLHATNALFLRALSEKAPERPFLLLYDKLLDCVVLFNSAFGLQILGVSIVTPLVMVQAIFFNLSQIVFPSVVRTIIVNVATLIKFLLFLVLSYMVAAPSQNIVKGFRDVRRMCHRFGAKMGKREGRGGVLELLCSQMGNRRTSISAAGFFDADYTMIVNILVSTVSYVIVFLQINAKLPKNL